MRWVQQEAFNGSQVFGQALANSTGFGNGFINGKRPGPGVWMTDVSTARRKLNPSRLQDQMFAYTVTNQIIGTFTEIGLPYILRFVDSLRNSKSKKTHSRTGSLGKKKRVVFEDEVAKQQSEKNGAGSEGEKEGREKEGKEDREFLERVRCEVALPPYDLFSDYSEMVTQFGYVVLWSTIWPLAPGLCFFSLSCIFTDN
jgi:anoctamin-10